MAQVPKLAGLNCPNCGAAIELRSFTNALSVVCQNCLSVLDARDPNLQVLQQVQAKQRITPEIPLGSRGTFAGGIFEAIGFQERTTYEDGEAYSWYEYLLFNPYKGFRYLTVFQGHWNFVRTLNTLPSAAGNAVRVGDSTFHMQSNSIAETTYVLGEFPWQVKVGEQVQVTDYVAPPKVLSAETTPEEIVWSMGEYISGEDVWKAFGLATAAPQSAGAAPNQPSPYAGTVASMWKTALILIGFAFLVAFVVLMMGSAKVIFQKQFVAGAGVAETFDIPGEEGNLELKTINHTGQPMFVEYSLTKVGGGKPLKFGRRVQPGSLGDAATLPTVAPGRYQLTADSEVMAGGMTGQYEIQIRRDVPSFSWLFGAIAFLLGPPILHSIRAMAFSRSRDMESAL